MTDDYLPEPLPSVLRALRRAVPETGSEAGKPATVYGVKRQMKDRGAGVEVAGSLKLLVSLGRATVQPVDPGSRIPAYCPTSWR